MDRIWLVILVVVAACQDPGDLAAGSGNRYCGTVVGSDDPALECEGNNCSFIRRSFAAGTMLELSFFPDLNGCMPPVRDSTIGVMRSTDGIFDCAYIDEIAPLKHDLLSQYDFPGAKRIRNYIYTTRISPAGQESRDLMLFFSVLDDGRAELRVVAGRGDERDGDIFGLFSMDLSPSGCS
ncbi:MAG: hypothetical protein H6714_03110 [Myxococcales bacterium]|nr:hypothetical protein [Myxococcales bacterium]